MPFKNTKIKSKYQQRWRLKNKEKIRIKRKEYYNSHKIFINLNRRKWRTQNLEKVKEYRKSYNLKNKHKYIDSDRNNKYKNKFGISLNQYNELLEKQNGVCAICLKPENIIDPQGGKIRRLSVDHDHKTGKVRGLLCYRCNVAIGFMYDDPYLLKIAIDYLLKNN